MGASRGKADRRGHRVGGMFRDAVFRATSYDAVTNASQAIIFDSFSIMIRRFSNARCEDKPYWIDA